MPPSTITTQSNVTLYALMVHRHTASKNYAQDFLWKSKSRYKQAFQSPYLTQQGVLI